MKVKKNININLSEDDVKQVIIDYLKKDGYEVIKDDINFSIGIRLAGHRFAEYKQPYFKGVCVSSSSEELSE